MKKVFFLLAMFTCIFASCSDEDESVTIGQSGTVEGSYSDGVVKIATAGTLKKLLGDDYLNIISLKIVGPINGSDVFCLRQMHWGDGQGGGARLATLDLSDATIVEGGEYYWIGSGEMGDEYEYTSNNVIGNHMFENSKNLCEVKLPENVTSIGMRAFAFSKALANIIIPDNVTSIGNNAFERCEVLTNVSIGHGVTSIGNDAFLSCDALGSVNIGSGVISIGTYAFSGCDVLTSIVIPDNVTSIGTHAFEACGALTNVSIGNGVTSISEEAFDGCTALTNVSIGSNVTSIGKGAFGQCSIKKCYCYATTPPTLEYDTYRLPDSVAYNFYFGVKRGATLYVPAGSGSAYEASKWSYIFDVIEEME